MEREFKYPQLKAGRKTGEEKFRVGGTEFGTSLLDFWRWSASDLVSNATRGVLAEYIVATALGLADGVRREWDAFDLLTKDGVRVEVKSAAYLQSWGHDRLVSGRGDRLGVGGRGEDASVLRR